MDSIADRRKFLTRFVQSPLRIGSVTPSSGRLVRAMLAPVQWEKVRTVVELGAGTGVVTRELKRWLRSGATAFIFENDPVLQGLLRRDHPELHHAVEAAAMGAVLEDRGFNKVDVILSSLPFANFPADISISILDQIRDRLTVDGVFTAYQYSLQMRRLLVERFRHVEVRFVPWNLPPAFVYTCRVPIR